MALTRKWKQTAPYPLGGTFGELLDWHLVVWWTAPTASKTSRGPPRPIRNFATAIHIGLPLGKDENSPERKLLNWRNGPDLPDPKIELRIFEELFGDNIELADWKHDLQEALDRERAAKRAKSQRVSTSTETVGTAVPRPAVHFMGRDDEVDALAALLASTEGPSAILVQGGPGMGKTELTKAVAHHPRTIADFGSQRFFVALETASSSAAMRDAIVAAIGGDQFIRFDLALERLNQRPALLVLDNLETPWSPPAERQATEEVVCEIAAFPNIYIVASFRGREIVGGCRWHEHVINPLNLKSAIELFASLAGSWANADDHIEQLSNALGGIPLAIQLVARRARGRTTLAMLWSEWKRLGSSLAVRPGFDAGRLTSLPHSIELSLQQLRSADGEHAALRLFRFLGVLPDGVTEHDVNRLLADDGFVAVEKLCQLGLAIERADRVDLLPPIRDHAREHYPPSDDEARKWPKHFIHALQGYLPRQDEAGLKNQQYLSESFHNLEQALMAAKDSRLVDHSAISGFCRVALMDFKSAESMAALADHYSQFQHALPEAICLQYMAALFADRGELQKAEDLYCKALRLFGESGDPAGRIDCMFGLAEIFAAQGDLPQATELAQAARGWVASLEDEEWGEADRMRSFGQIAEYDGRLELACNYFQRALPKYQRFHDRRSLAICHMHLGECLTKLDRHDQAKVSFDAARSHYVFLRNAFGIASSLKRLGDLHRIEGDPAEAANYYREAFDLFRNIGNASAMKSCANAISEVAGAEQTRA